MQKKKSNVLRVFLCSLTVVLLLAFSVVPCFAYNPDTGDPSNVPLWMGEPYSNRLDIREFGTAYNNDTYFAGLAFEYFDLLFRWGYLPARVVAIGVNLSTGVVEVFHGAGPTDVTVTATASDSSTSCTLNFAFGDTSRAGKLLTSYVIYGGGVSSTLNVVNIIGDTATVNRSNGVACYYYRNLLSNGSTGSIRVLAAENSGYVDAPSGGASGNDCFGVLRTAFLTFLNNNLNGDIIVEEVVEEVIVSEEIDVGALLTSYMQAGRILFDGWFGFEIFGINVASTLISILIIGIVIWIYRHLKGD